MSRLLSQPQLATAPRSLGAADRAAEPFTRALVAQAAEEAYARGHRDGERDGRVAAAAEIDRAAAAIREALAGAVPALRAALLDDTEAAVALALEVAEVVVGRVPHDGGEALVTRVRAVLDELDDAPLTLHAHPDDIAVLGPALAGTAGLEVVPDPELAPGEARVAGRWARADLTRSIAWDAVRRALDA